MEIVEYAKKLIEQGYSVIPVNSRKNPTIPKWGKYQINPMSLTECDEFFKDAAGMAILCGGKSRLFCMDFDLKYDLSGDLFERFKKAVPKELLMKAYVQTTINKGYHLVFKVPSTRLFGNERFASRYTTEYEQHETYMEAFRSVETRSKALKIAVNDKSRVLIESRSGSSTVCGGYFLIPPSNGYKKLHGKFTEITEQEYDLLVEVARSFNEVVKEETNHKMFTGIDWEKSPFEHYNEEGDAVEVLLNNGWSIVSENNSSVRLRRPGSTDNISSALFDKKQRVFTCFSTSVGFDPNKSYNASGVLCVLEFDGDFSKTLPYLVQNKWGIKKQ